MIGVEGGSTEGFLAGFSLESLIAPEDADTFLNTYWDRRPLAIKRGFRDFYTGLTSVADIDAAVAASAFRASYVDATNDEGRTWISDPDLPDRAAMDPLLARMAEGATLILDHADRVLPGLGRMARLLMAETGHAWHCNLYATPAGSQGFEAHVDDTGVFILQIAGTKDWIFGTRQLCRPVAGEGGGAAPANWDNEAEKTRLVPGDMLYLPRGVAHAARATDGASSLHITLTVAEASWTELSGMSAPASEADRDLLPIGFHRDPQALSAALAARHPGADGDRVSQFLTAQARRFRPDLAKRLIWCLEPKEVATDSHIRARKDLWWHVTEAEGMHHLICGQVRLAFPARAESFMQTLLKQGGILGDLDSDLSDAERIEIARMLVQHGLVRLR